MRQNIININDYFPINYEVLIVAIIKYYNILAIHANNV